MRRGVGYRPGVWRGSAGEVCRVRGRGCGSAPGEPALPESGVFGGTLCLADGKDGVAGGGAVGDGGGAGGRVEGPASGEGRVDGSMAGGAFVHVGQEANVVVG